MTNKGWAQINADEQTRDGRRKTGTQVEVAHQLKPQSVRLREGHLTTRLCTTVELFFLI